MISTGGDGYRLLSDHGIAEVRQKISNGQHALFATRHFSKEETITAFSAETISQEPTYLTLQTGEGRHITLSPTFLQFVNHSCDPNVFFDTTAMKLIALKEILPGEELVFFYPSTEWEMKQRFQCFCNSPRCLGEIGGAAFLSRPVLRKYRLTAFIQRRLSKRTPKVA